MLHWTSQYVQSRGRARNYMLVNSTGSRPGQLTPGRAPGPRGRSGLLEEICWESQPSHYVDWAIAVRTEGQDWAKICENSRAIIVLAVMLKSHSVRQCRRSTDCTQLMQHFVCLCTLRASNMWRWYVDCSKLCCQLLTVEGSYSDCCFRRNWRCVMLQRCGGCRKGVVLTCELWQEQEGWLKGGGESCSELSHLHSHQGCRSVKLTTHLHLVTSLWKSGAVLLFPLDA